MTDQLARLVTTNIEVNGVLLLTLGVVAIFWLTVLTLLLMRQMKINNALLDGGHPRSLKDIVLDQLAQVGSMQTELSNMESRLHDMHRMHNDSIQKIGLVRFSPFEDTGSDQSFTIALLDGNNSGVVISSLHGRDRTRIYTKKIIQGTSEEYGLSDEEKQAVHQAASLRTTPKK